MCILDDCKTDKASPMDYVSRTCRTLDVNCRRAQECSVNTGVKARQRVTSCMRV